jgi:multiple sugar transport system ATP-binding protein
VLLENGSRLAVPASRAADYQSHVGKPVVFGIRPESISSLAPRPGFDTFLANIDLVEPLGPQTMVYFNIGQVSLCASIEPESDPRPQTTMPLAFNMNQMHLFDSVSGKSLAA